ncbi:DNA polymerase I, thermostable [Clostridium tepidiprofundi DSM 19306]|uniref:DNA polymerase I n=1 Tax=Clostridium tepidiprofundi DSM 19306 TaxID=1121338 RepID=A0A151B2B3_9CLOT|nr:DNA polymerase I [Clostridium tepidiprofundi]KYH34016.1 DNA polymerase I, thermostable [Clostridium tepidiprofundi DSM 19306]
MNKERLLILDGNSLMYRAFYGMPALTNSEGLNTNAIYGFINMLIKMKEELKPDYIVTCFDKKAPTFRHKEYSEYKAGRKKMPPELEEQFPVLRDILKKLSINIFEIEGFEADDLIGTLSVLAEEKDMYVYIVTGDRDALQLATDNVKIVINKKGMTKKEIYDKSRIIEEFGVTPTEFIDVKGLMGDKSDNIPGVPGIGEKTAFKLIKEYKSIENILMNIDKLSGKKLKENLLNFSEQAIFSKKLATIEKHVPVEIDFDSIKSYDDKDLKGLKEIFLRLQFKSLIDKFPELKDVKVDMHNNTDTNAYNVEENSLLDVNTDYKEINTIDSLSNMVSTLNDYIFFCYDVNNEKKYSEIELEKIYIHSNQDNFILCINDLFKEDEKEFKILMSNIFASENIDFVGHSVKNFYTVMNKMGIKTKQALFDTEIAAYLIDPGKKEYSLKTLIEGIFHVEIDEEGEKSKIFNTIMLQKLYYDFEKKINMLNMDKLMYSIELPLTEVISSMESEGFNVDREMLDELGDKFSSEIKKVESEIFELADEEFNIRSPKQLGKILFEKLDLPVIKKTKTGYSTNVDVLEKLIDKHPIIEKIMYHRQLSKLYSTYVEGLKSVIDKDGRIHSSFNQTVTTTGRLSSTEPNLQNIPIKYEMGREIRKVFIPNDENGVILSADYSQIELRVLAHISNDENLINAFIHHSDIHTKTASEVFKVPIEEVTLLMRSNAKAVNFGIVYGIGSFSLAKDLNISKKEAQKYIDTYFERYPNVKKYLDNIVEEAKKNNMVTTILNRRRFIPEINASKKMVRAFGERLAMNTPIQGSAADIIKLAMVNVQNQLKKRGLKSTIILQVHDELILNVCKNEIEEVKELVKYEMENVMKGILEFRVPLEVDINIGNTWYEAK